jgi:hypothetical protein
MPLQAPSSSSCRNMLEVATTSTQAEQAAGQPVVNHLEAHLLAVCQMGMIAVSSEGPAVASRWVHKSVSDSSELQQPGSPPQGLVEPGESSRSDDTYTIHYHAEVYHGATTDVLLPTNAEEFVESCWAGHPSPHLLAGLSSCSLVPCSHDRLSAMTPSAGWAL